MPDATTYPTPSSAELRGRLEARTRSINDRLAALEREVTSVADLTVGGRPLPDWLRERALLFAGVGLAGGLVLGLLAGLRARATRRPALDEKMEVLRLYNALLVDDAAKRVARGEKAEEAVEKVLRRRPPIVYHAPPEKTPRSTLGETFDVAFKTAAGFAVKTGLDHLAKRFTHEDELFAAAKAVKENPTV
jgi:hypothetical protein